MQYNLKHKEKIAVYQKERNLCLEQTDVDYIIKHKLVDYCGLDSKHGHQYQEADYITVEWIKQQLINNKQCCFHCQKIMKTLVFELYDPDQFTADRLFNDMAHEQDNCVISCLACNLAHGSDDVY